MFVVVKTEGADAAMKDVKAEEDADREDSRAAVTATKKLDRIDKEREELMKRLAELKLEEKKLQGVAGVTGKGTSRVGRESRAAFPEKLGMLGTRLAQGLAQGRHEVRVA